MTTSSEDVSDDFVRCFQALDFVVQQCVPCVESILFLWHFKKLNNLPVCERPQPRPLSQPKACSVRGKPNLSSSCASCVAWANAVEEAYWPPTLKSNISWRNVNPSWLSTNHAEVAKIFSSVFRDNNCTKFEEFTNQSVLQLMVRFKHFHGGIADFVSKIEIVST